MGLLNPLILTAKLGPNDEKLKGVRFFKAWAKAVSALWPGLILYVIANLGPLYR
jgi:hypothetical protein